MYCCHNFLCGLFPRECHPTLVLPHFAFVDACILGEAASIDEIEILIYMNIRHRKLSD